MSQPTTGTSLVMRAVLFDFDGVLVDSEPLHFEALRDCLRPEGIEIELGEYLQHYLAYDDWGAIRRALERHGRAQDPERVRGIAERKAGIFQELMGRIPFFPGAPDLVRALASEVPLAIASGALRREIEEILEAGGLRGLFAAVVGADDVVNTKPHPEPYLAAMSALEPRAPGLRPAECLVIEDSMAGIAAALAAGMRVVGVAHSYPKAKLAAAHQVVESLEGLTPDRLRALFRPAPEAP